MDVRATASVMVLVVERLDRLERLTNVVLLLIDTERPLSLSNIADWVGGYPPAGEARRRAFERDKALLRDEGIAVTTVPIEGPEQYGYTIVPEDYYLPDLGLDEEEQVALNIAVSAVRLEGVGARDALLKLGILGSDEPVPTATLWNPPLLSSLEQAARERQSVSFDYKSERREVEPYGLVSNGGWWYLIGRDKVRSAIRRFRVDRIEGKTQFGDRAAFDAPPELDLSSQLPGAPWSLGEGEPEMAQVAVDSLMAPEVAAELGKKPVSHTDSGWSVFEVLVSHPPAFRSWVLGMLEHAAILTPSSMRKDFTQWLRAISDQAWVYPSEAGSDVS